MNTLWNKIAFGISIIFYIHIIYCWWTHTPISYTVGAFAVSYMTQYFADKMKKDKEKENERNNNIK